MLGQVYANGAAASCTIFPDSLLTGVTTANHAEVTGNGVHILVPLLAAVSAASCSGPPRSAQFEVRLRHLGPAAEIGLTGLLAQGAGTEITASGIRITIPGVGDILAERLNGGHVTLNGGATPTPTRAYSAQRRNASRTSSERVRSSAFRTSSTFLIIAGGSEIVMVWRALILVVLPCLTLRYHAGSTWVLLSRDRRIRENRLAGKAPAPPNVNPCAPLWGRRFRLPTPGAVPTGHSTRQNHEAKLFDGNFGCAKRTTSRRRSTSSVARRRPKSVMR